MLPCLARQGVLAPGVGANGINRNIAILTINLGNPTKYEPHEMTIRFTVTKAIATMFLTIRDVENRRSDLVLYSRDTLRSPRFAATARSK